MCCVYTMGKDGAAVYTKNLKAVSQGYCVDVVDTTGAGDSFIGAFEYQLLRDGVENIETVSKETFEEYLEFRMLMLHIPQQRLVRFCPWLLQAKWKNGWGKSDKY